MRINRLNIFTFTGLLRAILIVLLAVTSTVIYAQDTVLVAQDTLAISPDSLSVMRDTVPMRVDTIPPKKSPIESTIYYKANDSIVLLGNGTAFLHGEGDVTYQTMNLKSEYIRVKMDSSLVYARGELDTITEEWIGLPVFSEGKDSYESKEMTYNLRTQKGFIRHAVTEQGEGYIISERTKKTEGDMLTMADGKYTTCDDHEHPHFYLHLKKAKVKPGEYVATGPAYLVVGEVPLPLAIPFGFFPFTNSYSSGLIMPTFGDDRTRGLHLRGLGYYFAISDYMDLELTGDIYTKGTWAVYARSQYRKRYKFTGNFAFNYRVDVTGEKDMPDYSEATNMSIRWTHQQDAKANPYSNFSASVDFSTSGYNQSNINSYYNPQLNSQNTKSSSINYTQRFPDSPWSLSLSAMISQRTKDSTINLSLPDLNVNMSRVYPFKRKNPVGKEKWYEKIALQYSASVRNSIECKENYLFKSNFVKDWRNGVQHRIPISANFTAFKYLTITPSINYNERWYFKRVDQTWDEVEGQVVNDTTNGFYRVWDMSMSLSMQTKLYGFYMPIRKLFPNGKLDRVRHVLTPSIGFSYSPDCEDIRRKLDHNYYGFYDRPVVDRNTGDTIMERVEYNRFQGGMFGTPSKGQTGNLTFSLDNNIEMKIRNDKDTTGKEPYKVISLIDALTISGGYNFLADSLNLNKFAVRLRIKLPFNYTLNLSTNFDPYMYGLTPSGRPVRINQFYWNHGKFPLFEGTGTSLSYTFNNDTFRKWFGKKAKGDAPDANENEYLDENGNALTEEEIELREKEKQEKERNKKSEVEDGYIKTEMPWSLSVSYNVRCYRGGEFDYEKMYYKLAWTNVINLSGSLGLGKGWKVSASTSYDFKAKKWTYTNFNVSKDLHCWSMSGSFVPFGPYKSYTFHIGVNASMLADLKYDKSSADNTNKRVDWW